MRSKLDLLNELTSMKNYVEDNIEDINERKANQALESIKNVWSLIERRRANR